MIIQPLLAITKQKLWLLANYDVNYVTDHWKFTIKTISEDKAWNANQWTIICFKFVSYYDNFESFKNN
jgi:hypothetical protein